MSDDVPSRVSFEAAEFYEDDSTPTPAIGKALMTRTKTPRDSHSSIVEGADDFQFPLDRRASANGDSTTLATRQRIEECYDLLKNGAYFEGDAYAKEGIGRDVVNYIRGTSGWTFLHQAAFHQHEPAVEWLVKNGANKTFRGRFDGKTPYDVALTNGKAKGATRVMEMLEVKKEAPPRQGGAFVYGR
jgi:hypothetical protein